MTSLLSLEHLAGTEFHGYLKPITEEIEDQKQDFKLVVVHYDPETLLLLGTCMDECGISGIVGDIKANRITYKKLYVGTTKRASRMREWNYKGTMRTESGLIMMEGEYRQQGYHGFKPSGKWYVQSRMHHKTSNVHLMPF